jgi:hypothetical protein
VLNLASEDEIIEESKGFFFEEKLRNSDYYLVGGTVIFGKHLCWGKLLAYSG